MINIFLFFFILETKLTGLEFYCLNDTPYCEKCYKVSFSWFFFCIMETQIQLVSSLQISGPLEIWEHCNSYVTFSDTHIFSQIF